MKLRDLIIMGGVLFLVYKAGEFTGKVDKLCIKIERLSSAKGE